MTFSASALERIRQRIREQRILQETPPKPEELGIHFATKSLSDEELLHGEDKFGNPIEYNTEQTRAIRTIGNGEDCILLGAAGTGKTTVSKAAIARLVSKGIAGVLYSSGHKYLTDGTPGVVCVSYTRRAVMNLRRNMSEDMKSNCITIHKLLEYEPLYYDIIDPETKEEKKTMRFEATRHAMRPLPESIKTIIIDESSMVSVELFKEIENACPHKPQFVFIGDIQQLPPVFGSAILGYKMLELPTVELTQVYRQALESPIIRLAHRILSGKPVKSAEYEKWKIQDQLTLHPWKKKIHADNACLTFAKWITQSYDLGKYNPEEDIILIPFNKSFGTDEINRHIGNHLARKNERVTYEIIAGFNKHYFSEGDKVLYDKEDAFISKIETNPIYSGAMPQEPSKTLDYWGFKQQKEHHIKEQTDEDIDFLLSQMAVAQTDEERVQQCSHLITVCMVDTGAYVTLRTASDINSLIMGYALTVHKAQGSEWRKVFLVLHQSHATMLQRELLYTAVTRAKEELYVICEPESFTKGIESQRIKGNTLAEKAEFFKGKLERENGVKK